MAWKRGIRLWRRFFALTLTSELGLTAVRSRSRKTTLSCFLILSRRYATRSTAQMQHTDKVGILPGEQIKLNLVQIGTITANNTASGNTQFCDSESRRGALVLVATRSHFGSDVINVIHYRNTATLPLVPEPKNNHRSISSIQNSITSFLKK